MQTLIFFNAHSISFLLDCKNMLPFYSSLDIIPVGQYSDIPADRCRYYIFM